MPSPEVLESESKPVEETVTSAENVGQEQSQAAAVDENKPTEITEPKIDDASAVEKPVESVGENVEQPKAPIEGEAKTEVVQGEDSKIEDSLDKAMDGAGSDTAVESDVDSDFDVMEEIDPSYAIDPNLWTKVADIDACDLKPAKKEVPGEEGEEKKPEKKAKKEEAEEDVEEDSGFSEIVIRSEKERDQEFQEYIFELCRPSIVSYLPDRVAPKGSNVRLTCTVQGNNIQTKWMKDEVTIERGKRLQTKSDGEIHSLEISEITEKDAGVYTAVFKNRAGEVETSSHVKVYDGKLHKPDHIDIALVKGELNVCAMIWRLFLFIERAKFIIATIGDLNSISIENLFANKNISAVH